MAILIRINDWLESVSFYLGLRLLLFEFEYFVALIKWSRLHPGIDSQSSHTEIFFPSNLPLKVFH